MTYDLLWTNNTKFLIEQQHITGETSQRNTGEEYIFVIYQKLCNLLYDKVQNKGKFAFYDGFKQKMSMIFTSSKGNLC